MARTLIFRCADRTGGAGGGRRAGFTLVELMVVLTLVATVAVLAVPAGRSVLPGFALRSAAEDMADSARSARRDAMLGQSESWLELDLERRRYRRAGAEWRTLPQTATLNIVTAARERTDSGGRIRFYADGGASGGEIKLAEGARAHSIRVDWLTGAVRLVDEAGG